ARLLDLLAGPLDAGGELVDRRGELVDDRGALVLRPDDERYFRHARDPLSGLASSPRAAGRCRSCVKYPHRELPPPRQVMPVAAATPQYATPCRLPVAGPAPYARSAA